MSYFDHVQCHSCGARMDPEKLVPGRGEMPSCPHCQATLNLADLFGVKDSFVGLHDDEGNDHTLDDLVGGTLYDGRYAGGQAPAPSSSGPSRASQPARPAYQGAAAGPAGQRALPGPAAGPNAMVRRAAEPETSPSGNGPSAMDLLREMKKKR